MSDEQLARPEKLAEAPTGADLNQWSSKPVPVVRGFILAVAGIAVVACIVVVVFFDDVPYLMPGVEPVLDSALRYKVSKNVEVKDWKTDLVIEQSIWMSEISKVEMSMKNAKPSKMMRDFKLYLADSFFKTGLQYAQAKATYLSALLEPKFKEQRSFPVTESEIYGRLGTCCLRIGEAASAENYFRKTLAAVESNKTETGAYKEPGRYVEVIDNITASLIAQGKADEAQKMIDTRLTRIQLKDIANCIERPLLANAARLAAFRGDNLTAEKLFKRTIELYREEVAGREPEPDPVFRGDRFMAVVIREYAALLRKTGKFAEADEQMKASLDLLDNAP